MTCSRPQRKAPRLRIEPGTSGTGVNHSTPATRQMTLFHQGNTLQTVQSTCTENCHADDKRSYRHDSRADSYRYDRRVDGLSP